MSIRLFVIDDNKIMRMGVRTFLGGRNGDFEIAGEAGTGAEALKMAEEIPTDVYILDIGMPDMDGIEIMDRLLKRDPESRILILTVETEEDVARKAMEHGARGYVIKPTASENLCEAIRRVHAGGRFISPSLPKRVMARRFRGKRKSEGNGRNGQLTPRQKEIVGLIAEGCSTKDIARELHLQYGTVHTHRRNIMQKLNIHKETQLVAYAFREGYVSKRGRNRGWPSK